MGSLLSKEVFYLSLYLITLFSLASCGSTANRALAQENEVKRVPPENYNTDTDYSNGNGNGNKIVNRQYAGDRN